MSFVRKYAAVASNTQPTVKISDYILDPRLQMRVRDGAQDYAAPDAAKQFDEKQVSELLDLLNDGFELKPVELVRVNGQLWLAHGYHRHEAYRRAGREEIPATIVDGTWVDALRIAWAANDEHGLKLTNADKNRKVRSAILYYQQAGDVISDGEIARQTRTSVTFVGNVRRMIEAERSAVLSASEPAANLDANPEPRTVTVRRGAITYEMAVNKIGRKPKATDKPAPVQSEPAPVQSEPAPVQPKPAPVQSESAPVQPKPANFVAPGPATDQPISIPATQPANFVPVKLADRDGLPCHSLVVCLTVPQLKALRFVVKDWADDGNEWAQIIMDASEALLRGKD